jgi:hypothetical protein
MNITELTNNGPTALTALVKITLPTTIGVAILILFGKYGWVWLMGRKRPGGYLYNRRYFIGDRRESPTFYDRAGSLSPGSSLLPR